MSHLARLQLVGRVSYYLGWFALVCGGLLWTTSSGDSLKPLQVIRSKGRPAPFGKLEVQRKIAGRGAPLCGSGRPVVTDGDC